MKNRLICLVAFLCIFTFQNNSLFAQITLNNGGGTGYMSVQTYNGVEFKSHYILQIDINGTNQNLANWELVVRVDRPIRNSEGKTLDPSKVSLRLNSISGNGAPTIQDIGATIRPIPLSLAETPIIENSRAQLATGPTEYHKQIRISFDIIIAAGSYLEALKSWQNYNMNLLFSLRKNSKQVVSQTIREFQMQIYPAGVPPIDPVTPQLGIQVNSSARNGLLEFKSISDYVNGVSQSYERGLSITSNTPYSLQVKAVSANLVSNNNTLPINTVSLSIQETDNPAVGGVIILSENNQTVFNALNTGTQARLFDIRYFTNPNDQRMLNAKPANYQTTLTYTLIPL